VVRQHHQEAPLAADEEAGAPWLGRSLVSGSARQSLNRPRAVVRTRLEGVSTDAHEWVEQHEDPGTRSGVAIGAAEAADARSDHGDVTCSPERGTTVASAS
jgi:hypothetical protein